MVICPITTGDTSLRSSRITIADALNLNHEKINFKTKSSNTIVSGIIWINLRWFQFNLEIFCMVSVNNSYNSNLPLQQQFTWIKRQKPYIVALLPAIVCTLIAFAYILQAPEGLRIKFSVCQCYFAYCNTHYTVSFLQKI